MSKDNYKENILRGYLQRLSPLQYFVIRAHGSISAAETEMILMTTLESV